MLFVYTIEMRTYVTFSLKEALQIASGLNGISYSLHLYTKETKMPQFELKISFAIQLLFLISAEVHWFWSFFFRFYSRAHVYVDANLPLKLYA